MNTATPAVLSEELPPMAQWDEPLVQTIYELLCSEEAPPTGIHWWEGWTARRIADLLATVPASSLPVAQAPQAQTSERHFALREAHGIGDADAYFAARPDVLDDDFTRGVFHAGHSRGFDAAEKVYATTPALPVSAAQELSGQSRDALEGCRRALEVIAVGDSKDPIRDAADELVALGFWRAESVAQARSAQALPAQAAGEPRVSKAVWSINQVVEMAAEHGLGRAMTPIGLDTGLVFATERGYRTSELIAFADAVARLALSAPSEGQAGEPPTSPQAGASDQ